MSEKLPVTIVEFVNGSPRHLWYGIQECAYHHHLHPYMLKELIVNGNPLPGSVPGELVTFDIDPSSESDIVRAPDGKCFVVSTKGSGTSKAKGRLE